MAASFDIERKISEIEAELADLDHHRDQLLDELTQLRRQLLQKDSVQDEGEITGARAVILDETENEPWKLTPSRKPFTERYVRWSERTSGVSLPPTQFA